MNKKRASFSNALGLILLIILGTSGAWAAGDRLNRGNGPEPETLDPHHVRDVYASNIVRDLFEGLVTRGPRAEILPGVAEKWEISPDQKTYTFYLRENAKWSNGQPVTADDFLYSFRRSVDPVTAAPNASLLRDIKNAMPIIKGKMPASDLGVQVIAPHILKIQLEAVAPYILEILSEAQAAPVSRANVEANPKLFTSPEKMVSNGAYILTKRVFDAYLQLKKNPQYWDAINTKIENVYYFSFSSKNTETSSFRSGQLDLTSGLPFHSINFMKEKAPADVFESPYLATYFYGVNLTQVPFRDNPSLRRALSLAIDRKAVVNQLINGAGEPAYTYLPPTLAGFQNRAPDWSTWSNAKRELEAKRMFALACPDNCPGLQIEFSYDTSENHEVVALGIIAAWKKLFGLNTNIKNMEWGVFLDTRAQKKETQIFRDTWIAQYSDAGNFLDILKSTHPFNDYGFANSKFDDLVAEAEKTTDLQTRTALFAQAEDIVLEELPIIPIYYYKTVRLKKPYVKGYEANSHDIHMSKYIYFEKQKDR